MTIFLSFQVLLLGSDLNMNLLVFFSLPVKVSGLFAAGCFLDLLSDSAPAAKCCGLSVSLPLMPSVLITASASETDGFSRACSLPH